jgi:hypothetical protein
MHGTYRKPSPGGKREKGRISPLRARSDAPQCQKFLSALSILANVFSFPITSSK